MTTFVEEAVRVAADAETIRALRASESRYRRLFETAQDAILILDGDDGKVIDANPFVIGLLGYSLEELIGRELWQIGLFHDIEESKAAFDRLKKDGYIRYEDLPLETKDGKRAEVEFVSNTYEVDGRNIIQCNIRDITDRKSAERAAVEGAERFRFLAESMPQMVFAATADGNVDYFNQQWSEFTGLSFEVLKGRGWTQCIHPDEQPGCAIAWQHSLSTGEPFHLQYRLRLASGVYRWHLTRANAMRDGNGDILMWVGSTTDIDDQKRTEENLSHLYAEAAMLNRAKDAFLTNVSHELRTPMTSILGWTALLVMGKLDETAQREGIATIHRSAKVQAQLIDDILDVSRLITGKLHLTIEPIDMESVLRGALSAIVPAADAKDIHIGMNFESGLPLVGGDPVRLQQVFWNLLSNGLKFTPAGGRIDIRLFSSNSGIVVEVQDSGIGISPEFLPYAFDRFAQQDGGTRRPHGGMGIGLSIVKQLVELHGGTVSAESEGESHGSTFRVAIPVQPAIPARVPREGTREWRANASVREIPSIAGLRILIVDDEPDSRRTIGAILEQYGGIVTAAATASEGVRLAEQNSFDVIASDIAMPDEDGYSLIHRIRAGTGEKSQIPAVALTAYGRPLEREIALTEGFDEYLKKPVEPGELVALIAGVARKSVLELRQDVG